MSSHLAERIADGLHRLAVRRGGLVLAAALVLTAPLGFGWLRLPWTDDPEVIALQGSDALEFYRGYVRRWGSDKWIVLAYDAGDAFAPARLAQLRELTGALLELPGVRWVASLDSAFAIEDGPMGPYARPLVPDALGPTDAIRRTALASRWLRDSLVSADGSTLALAVELEGGELDTRALERQVLAGIDAVLARPAFADLRVYRAGAPVFGRELERLNGRDQALFVPLTVAVVGLFLLLLLRSARLAAAALGVLLLSVVWTLGAMYWLGVAMNITTGLLPPLLLVISIAESVHVISAYGERLRAGESPSDALRAVLHEVLPACFWTTLTTAVGFASLLAVRIESVRSFAAFAVLGVWVALAQLALVLPALLLRLRMPAAGAAAGARASGWIEALLALAQRAARSPRSALALVAAALLLAAVGMPRLDVSTHDGEFFSERNPLNQAYRFIEARLQGVTPLEVEVRAPQAGAFRSAPAIRRLAALQRELGAQPRVSAGLSLADLVLEVDPQLDLADDDAVQRALFLLGALAPDEAERFTREDGRVARVSARTKAMSSAENEALLAALQARAAELFPADWEVRFTGLVPVASQMEQYLVSGQVQSYGLAVAVIAAIFALLFRSAGLVAAALAANVAPVLATLGAMGLAGIRLDVATIMVACIAEGIIVDDTVHVIHAFRHGLRQFGSAERALAYALEVSGRAVVITSLILAAGFAIPMLSDFQPTAHFGMLVAFTVLTALAGELFILPPALLWLHRGARAEEPV